MLKIKAFFDFLLKITGGAVFAYLAFIAVALATGGGAWDALPKEAYYLGGSLSGCILLICSFIATLDFWEAING